MEIIHGRIGSILLRRELKIRGGTGESRKAKSGVGVLEEGSKPPPHQLGGLGECCKLSQWAEIQPSNVFTTF